MNQGPVVTAGSCHTGTPSVHEAAPSSVRGLPRGGRPSAGPRILVVRRPRHRPGRRQNRSIRRASRQHRFRDDPSTTAAARARPSEQRTRRPHVADRSAAASRHAAPDGSAVAPAVRFETDLGRRLERQHRNAGAAITRSRTLWSSTVRQTQGHSCSPCSTPTRSSTPGRSTHDGSNRGSARADACSSSLRRSRIMPQPDARPQMGPVRERNRCWRSRRHRDREPNS